MDEAPVRGDHRHWRAWGRRKFSKLLPCFPPTGAVHLPILPFASASAQLCFDKGRMSTAQRLRERPSVADKEGGTCVS